jgi:hypothetical protein
MRNRTKVLFLFAVMAIALMAFTGAASAATWRSANTVNIAKGIVIDDDLYVGAGNITIDGDVTGNLFIGGGNVTVNGNIGGSVYASAGTVVFNGKAAGDLIAAGGQVTLNGSVEKNIIACGGTISVGAKVGLDVLAAGGTISVDSPVGRDVLGSGGTINLNAPVGRNAVLATDTMKITGPIEGNLNYYATKQMDVASGTVKGKVEYHQTAQQTQNRNNNSAGSSMAAFMFGVFWFFVMLIGRLIIGALFAGVTPKAAIFTADAIKTRPWASLGIGALVLFFGPTMMFIMAITLIGLPAAGYAFTLYMFAIYMSMIVTGTFLGRWVLGMMMKREPNTIAAMALGVTALAFVTSIPILGWLISFVSILFGMGALTIGFMALLRAGKIKK